MERDIVLIEHYRLYEIHTADKRGGKAGRGHNVTSTVQVREVLPSGWLLKAQVRFTVGSKESKAEAVRVAKERVDILSTVIPCPKCKEPMEVDKDRIAGDFYCQCRNVKCEYDGWNAETLSDLLKAIPPPPYR